MECNYKTKTLDSSEAGLMKTLKRLVQIRLQCEYCHIISYFK